MPNRTIAGAPSSSFDSHHPPSPALIDQCVHCGFCLPVCPTYVLWNEEMDSPRGRIYLMKMASEGATELTPQWVSHFDSCLGCMACMTACPSGVDYAKLIGATRAQIERNQTRSLGERLFRHFVFSIFPRPDRLRLIRWPLLAYQRSGLQSLLRAVGIPKLLPRKLQAMESFLPKLSGREKIAEVTPAYGARRMRVALLLGCVQREFLPQVNAATVHVLAAEGCEVVAPSEQSCCGALHLHAGEEAAAIALARKTIDAFECAGVDFVVINAAGCGSCVKEYGHLLRDDAQYSARAAAFAAKCKDVSEFLAGVEPRATRHPLPLRVAFHDSCHLQHAQGVRSEPRALLSKIPGLDLLEIPESPICCGSAGIYNLVQPAAASALGDRKAQLIAALQADIVATGNPGCLLQLKFSLQKIGKKTPVVHTIQLLDASLRGKAQDFWK